MHRGETPLADDARFVHVAPERDKRGRPTTDAHTLVEVTAWLWGELADQLDIRLAAMLKRTAESCARLSVTAWPPDDETWRIASQFIISGCAAFGEDA